MALDPATAGKHPSKDKSLREALTDLYDSEIITEKFRELLAKAYDTYAKEGKVVSADTGNEDWKIIEQGFKDTQPFAVVGDKVNAVLTLATAFANYWSGAHTVSGTAAHGGVKVTSVANNAATLTDSFVSAINTTMNAAPPTGEYIVLLAENIETIAVSKIIWTITEQTADGKIITATETIS